jgi:hypothetical protein
MLRKKHGMPLIPDDKPKAPKKKNLQVIAVARCLSGVMRV